jgi:glycosyltransferase involved in cell wall biosynthesis
MAPALHVRPPLRRLPAFAGGGVGGNDLALRSDRDAHASSGAEDTGVPMTPVRRVLLICEATGGGVGRHVLDLAEGGRALGIEVMVAYSPTRMEPGFARRLESLQGKGVEATSIPMPRGIDTPWRDVSAIRGLCGLVRRWAPDLLHGHSSKGGAYARIVGAVMGLPVAYTPNAFVFAAGVHSLTDRLYVLLERLMARVTDLLICVSESEREVALRNRIHARALQVICNGIDTPVARVTAERPRAGNGELAIISVGRLAPQKDPLLWARIAVALQHQVRPRPRMTWAGDGPLASEVANILGDGGREAGVLLGHRDDVPDLLSGADVFLMTSVYEGLPYALLEAMAAGVACIVRDSPGVTEVVEHDVSGLVIHGSKIDDYCEAIERVVADPALLQRLGRGAAMRVRGVYSRDAMVRRTVAAYGELLTATAG